MCSAIEYKIRGVFSALGDIYDDKRHRLSEEHAHQQLFLRYIYSKDDIEEL